MGCLLRGKEEKRGGGPKISAKMTVCLFSEPNVIEIAKRNFKFLSKSRYVVRKKAPSAMRGILPPYKGIIVVKQGEKASACCRRDGRGREKNTKGVTIGGGSQARGGCKSAAPRVGGKGAVERGGGHQEGIINGRGGDYGTSAGHDERTTARKKTRRRKTFI